MRLNFALLNESNEKQAGTAGTNGDTSNGAGLLVPALQETSGDWRGLKITSPRLSPLSPRLVESLKPSNGGESPLVPAVPATKTQFSKNQPIGAKSTPFVVTFELDGCRVTCIDPISETLEESIAELHRRFYGRVGRMWQLDIELTDHKQELTR